jgi:asparagine synthase (glutamine-hydrolysing)
MCGISGACWTDAKLEVTSDQLRKMTDAIRHRGPDDAGQWISNLSSTGVALGHRRLSIIDLDSGHQPLGNEDGSIQIVFNGEIYNYVELREELLQRGHTFQTHTDTEVIVHLYEELGPECVKRFRGMFAFALWDQKLQRLLLARDRLGKKPLVYRHDPGRLIFASELKALLTLQGIPRELNPIAVDQYLTYQYVPHPHSILKGFHKLPPASYALYERDQLQVVRYWTPPFDVKYVEEAADPELRHSYSWDLKKWQTKLRDALTEAVRIRLRSNVPLGAFLSGGVDSTLIAGLMQQVSTTPVHTFSIGFPVEKFDERKYARMAADHLKTKHHEFLVDPQALTMLPDLVWHYDEPFGDSSAIPTMYLSRMTRQEVTVALSGDGGDELFAGYERYSAVRLAQNYDRLPAFLRQAISSPLWQKIPASVSPKSKRRRLKRFLKALSLSPERRYLSWIEIFDCERRCELYSSEMSAQLDGNDSADVLLEAYAVSQHRDFVTRTTAADVMSYLPCDILTKVDIASMSTGLECRSPLLDHHVVELAARMPMEHKIKGNVSKWILKETFPDLIPEPIRNRPKMGFGVPLDSWFRNELQPLLNDVLTSKRCLERGYFKPHAIQTMIEQHQQKQMDHSSRLWALLMLELWMQKFLDT